MSVLLLQNACRQCHSIDNTKECPKCRAIYYCSETCKKLDAEIHKVFCSTPKNVVSTDLHCIACLTSIKKMDVFRVLLHDKFLKNHNKCGFFFLSDDSRKYLSLESYQETLRLGVKITKKQHAELTHYVGKAHEKAIYVLYQIAGATQLYSISSKKMLEMKASIDLLAPPLVDRIYLMAFGKEVGQKNLKPPS